MWTRKELKAQAKAALKRNYWKAVLVTTLVLTVMKTAGSTASSGFAALGSTADAGSVLLGSVFAYLNEYLPGLVAALVIVAVLAVLVSLAISILLINPIEVGFAAFRVNTLRGEGNVGDLGRGFDASYKRNVLTILTMIVRTFLWTLLFIVPGIIKAYEYAMIPYLLADHPEMTREEAFAASREMMQGNKWKAFVLDLSFILWSLLSALTLGVLSVLYVQPYRRLTEAALYETLAAARAGRKA